MDAESIYYIQRLEKELEIAENKIKILSDEVHTNQDNCKHYKEAFNYAQDHLNRIACYLLGNNWVACDTGNYWNVDPIIEETIKKRYDDVNIKKGFRYWLGRKLLKIDN